MLLFGQSIIPCNRERRTNVRLAAKLTGWKIDIKSETQLREYIESQLLNINNGEKGERYIEPEVVLNEEEAEDAAENIAEDETADVVEEAAQAQDKADEADDEAKEE